MNLFFVIKLHQRVIKIDQFFNYRRRTEKKANNDIEFKNHQIDFRFRKSHFMRLIKNDSIEQFLNKRNVFYCFLFDHLFIIRIFFKSKSSCDDISFAFLRILIFIRKNFDFCDVEYLTFLSRMR